MDALPELLRPSEAMVFLGIKHPDTLRRLRRAHPTIAVRWGSMKHHRYVTARLVALRQNPGRPCN